MARLKQEQKQLNHEKILQAAGRAFRNNGVNGISIADLMKTAEMTHGGFYNHFSSKDSLAAEVFRRAFSDSLDTLAAIREAHPHSGRTALHHVIDQYVTTLHRDHPENSCPSAALVSDAARLGVAAQTEYRYGLNGYFAAIADMLLDNAHQSGSELNAEEAREQAIALFSQMVGALVVSQAVVKASPDLSNEILKANNTRLKQA